MKVHLAKHGGLAAAIRRPPVTVESSTLPNDKAEELARLVAAVKTEPLAAAEESPGRARDAMSYVITLREDGGGTAVLRRSDVTMSPAFAALLQWIERTAAGK